MSTIILSLLSHVHHGGECYGGGPIQHTIDLAKAGLYDSTSTGCTQGFSSRDWLTWATVPTSLPVNSSNPTYATKNFYSRTTGPCPQPSPFDLRIAVYDDVGNTLHSSNKYFLSNLVNNLYFWSPNIWRKILLKKGFNETYVAQLLSTRAMTFWEHLGEIIVGKTLNSEPSLNADISQLLLFYGPSCLQLNGTVDPRCLNTTGIKDARSLRVLTHVDGRRDILNPTTRWIHMTANTTGSGFIVSSVLYEVEVQGGPGRASLPVASKQHESIDIRPYLGGRQNSTYSLRVFGESLARRSLYPDYNRIYFPLRHLALQVLCSSPIRCLEF